MQVKNAQTPRNSTVSFGLQNRVPRVQVLLPLPKTRYRKKRYLVFCCSKRFVPSEARGACRASPPKRRRWRIQRGGDGAAVKIACRSKAKAILGTARGLAKQVRVLLPLSKRKTSLSRCLSFLYVVKLALRGTRSVPGIAAEAPPVADTARR